MPYKPRIHKVKLPGRKDEAGRRLIHSTKAQRRAIEIRNSARWKRVSAGFRNSSEGCLCCDPFGDHGLRVVSTDDVHHIVPLVVDPSLAFVRSNWAPLCRTCHNRVEKMNQAGQRTQQFFPIGVGG